MRVDDHAARGAWPRRWPRRSPPAAAAAAAAASSAGRRRRVGAGRHRDAPSPIGSALPAHRPGGAGLQRDRAGDRRLLQLRQRQRRHQRPQDQVRSRATTATTRPTRSRSTKQLVLQDKVFAIFNGLGTPTHTQVVDFLNQLRCPTCSSPPAAVLGRPEEAPVHVRLAARLHCRGQDPRQVHQEELRRQEGRLLLPERRLRQGRRRGPRHVDPQGAGRRRARPTSPATPTSGRRWRSSRRRAPRSWRRSRSRPTPRCELAAQARLQPAAGGQQRRLRPDDADRPAEGVLEGQGRQRR